MAKTNYNGTYFDVPQGYAKGGHVKRAIPGSVSEERSDKRRGIHETAGQESKEMAMAKGGHAKKHPKAKVVARIEPKMPPPMGALGALRPPAASMMAPGRPMGRPMPVAARPMPPVTAGPAAMAKGGKTRC